MADAKWSDDSFLNNLRQHVDTTADECVADLPRNDSYASLFSRAGINRDTLPDDAPESLRTFFATSDLQLLLEKDKDRFPDGLDFERLKRGELVFLEHAFTFCLILLAKSLPEGYAAPCLAELLNLSGNLATQPYRRLLGTLQLVVNVSSVGGFLPDGRALASARQARLMHAGIRQFLPRMVPDYNARYGGPPINLEDMLGTIMGLSLLVIEGVPKLWNEPSREAAEDYYYIWRAYAVAMGIHPPGEEGTDGWVPASLDDARAFYNSYERRHYVNDPSKNPDGVALARENLLMLEHLLPKPLEAIGLRHLPRLFMTELMGARSCQRVGIEPAHKSLLFYPLLVAGVSISLKALHELDRLDPKGNIHPTLSRLLLQGMIDKEYGGFVTFSIPDSIKQVQEMVARRKRAGETTRDRQRPVQT